jgi:hypothetical protein
MKKGFLFYWLFLLCNSVWAQTIVFDMNAFGQDIGRMTVTRIQEKDGGEFYVLETKSKAKVLWINRENYTHYEVRYKDGKLISASHIETENGKTKRWSKVNFDGKLYQVDSYKGKKTFSEAPNYSIVTIYFKDYQKVQRIFYEAETDFSDLKHPDNNTIEFKSSDGNRNVYHFENGKIKSMEFHVSIATVYMNRLN